MELVQPESHSVNHLSLSKLSGPRWFSVLLKSVVGPIIFRYWSLLQRAISKVNLEGVNLISCQK